MFRVRAVGTGWTGGPGLLTWYVDVGSVYSVTTATAAAERVRAMLYAARGLMHTSTTWTVTPDCDVVTPATGVITETFTAGVTPFPVVGADTGSMAAPIVALLLRYTTADFVKGRRVKGRSFLSPIPASAIGPTGILAPSVAAGVTAFTEAAMSPDSVSSHLLVWHRPKLGLGGSVHAVTGISAASKLSYLSSRRD